MRIEAQFLEVDKSSNRDLISGNITLPRIIRGKSFVLNRKKSSLLNSLNRRKSSILTPLYPQSGEGINRPQVKLITPAAENVESARAKLKREREEPYLLDPGDDIIMPPIKRKKSYKKHKQIGRGRKQIGKGKRKQVGKGRKKQVGKGRKKQVGKGRKKQIGKGQKKRKLAKKNKKTLFDQFSL